MKKLWLLVCLALCLCCCTAAMVEELDAEEKAAIFCTFNDAYCDAPTVCIQCGKTLTNPWIVHHEVYVDLGDTHQVVCTACDYVEEPEYHSVKCDAPTTCQYCGKEGVTDCYVYHVESRYVDIGDNKHQKQCDWCGFVDAPSLHDVWCDEPTRCLMCDAEGLTMEPNGHTNIKWNDLGTEHQQYCKTCGKTWDAEEHYGYCNEPTTCMGCHKENVSIPEGNVGHNVAYENDEVGCWSVCVYCDYEGEPNPHIGSCRTPNRCVNCGEEEVIIEPESLIHNNSHYENLGDMHQMVCDYCGYKEEPWKHYGRCNAAEPNYCYVCEKYVDEIEIYHTNTYYVDLGDMHQWVCDYCDYSEAGRHYVACYKPETCLLCDATVSVHEEEYLHPSLLNEHITDAKHSFDCDSCQKHIEYAHAYLNGTCIVCGYKKGTQSPSVPGDVDGSSAVTLNDAFVILERSYSGDESADVTGDGQVDAYDALRVLQYLAGWNVTLE